VRCTVIDWWTDKQHEIDDRISLTTSRAGFAGRQWLFVCPALGLKARTLYLPDGARYFRSRQAYDLAYETEHLDDRERAWRRVRKCRAQLDSDPGGLGEPYPEKPAKMSPAKYAYLRDRLDAAEADLSLPLTLRLLVDRQHHGMGRLRLRAGRTSPSARNATATRADIDLPSTGQ
jgi:hypothetical protein